MRANTKAIMMDIAREVATLSHAKRAKVGAVLVRSGRVIATGYNGTLPGIDNCCENEDGSTNDFVMHAEQNVITYCAAQGIPTKDAILFVTMAPCKECAKLIVSSGISQVYYREAYRDTEGTEFVKKFIFIEKFTQDVI